MNPSSSAEALTQLQDFQRNRRSSQQVLEEFETKAGLPDARKRHAGLRTAIGNTENLIRSIEPSVMGRTAGVNATDAQRQRLIAMEREPITEQLREQSRSLENEETNISSLGQRASRDAQLRLSEDEQRNSFLSGLYGMLLDREKQAEDRRRFEEQLRLERENAAREAAASRSRGGGGGGAKAAAQVPTRKQIYGAIGGNLAAVRGKDGFVSPQSYAKAKSDFIKAGYSGREFDVQWSNLRNPENPYYKLG